MTDPRRRVPRTDMALDDPRLVAAAATLGRETVKQLIIGAQRRVRDGLLDPEELLDDVIARLPAGAASLRQVINATGVVLHTNLGRAPLSDAAVRAVVEVAGYVDVEFDLPRGARTVRGRAATAALHAALPDADDVLVVNNGAAALLLATTALASGREVVISRGELVEIGDGFRLPTLIESTGVRIREVGTTNRVQLRDYADAIGPATGCLVKIHPSNFRVEGFTSSVPVAELASLPVPVVADVGSGLLAPMALLPDEPDVTSALRAGAALATCSGDKLLGGPQAGLIAGRADLVDQLRHHPLARALRVDKLTLAALEATLRGPAAPTTMYLDADPTELKRRCARVAAAIDATVVESTGAVGGGGAPGVELPGWAVSLPEQLARPLRLGDPPVVGRIERGRCLLDLRCVPSDRDDDVIRAIKAASTAAVSIATKAAGTVAGTAEATMAGPAMD